MTWLISEPPHDRTKQQQQQQQQQQKNFFHAVSEDWSDWADARADLSLRWAHMPLCLFCHEAAQLCLKLTWKQNHNITYMITETLNIKKKPDVHFYAFFLSIVHSKEPRYNILNFYTLMDWV